MTIRPDNSLTTEEQNIQRFTLIDLKLSNQRFLIGQLYTHLFLQSPQSWETLPADLIEATKHRTTQNGTLDAEQFALQTEFMTQDIENFFNAIALRLKK